MWCPGIREHRQRRGAGPPPPNGLNRSERIRPGYAPGFFDLNVASVHFYHNLVFVYRGRNDDESNVLRANVAPAWVAGE